MKQIVLIVIATLECAWMLDGHIKSICRDFALFRCIYHK